MDISSLTNIIHASTFISFLSLSTLLITVPLLNNIINEIDMEMVQEMEEIDVKCRFLKCIDI